VGAFLGSEKPSLICLILSCTFCCCFSGILIHAGLGFLASASIHAGLFDDDFENASLKRVAPLLFLRL
jgi:hypothetical protein